MPGGVAGVPPIMGVPYADALIKVLGLGGLLAKVTELIQAETMRREKILRWWLNMNISGSIIYVNGSGLADLRMNIWLYVVRSKNRRTPLVSTTGKMVLPQSDSN